MNIRARSRDDDGDTHTLNTKKHGIYDELIAHVALVPCVFCHIFLARFSELFSQLRRSRNERTRLPLIHTMGEHVEHTKSTENTFFMWFYSKLNEQKMCACFSFSSFYLLLATEVHVALLLYCHIFVPIYCLLTHTENMPKTIKAERKRASHTQIIVDVVHNENGNASMCMSTKYNQRPKTLFEYIYRFIPIHTI